MSYCFRNRSRPSESVASDHDMDVASDHDMARSNDPTRSGNAQNNTWVQKAEGADNYLVSSANLLANFQRELRGICGNIGQVEAPTTCLKCKSGVEHHYCTRNHSRPSKSLAGHDMDQVKSQNIIPAGSFPSRYVEQLHPTRSGNTRNDASVQKAKGADNYFSLFRGTFRLKDEKTTSIHLGAHPTLHAPLKVGRVHFPPRAVIGTSFFGGAALMDWTCWYFLLKFFPKIILRELRDICGKGVEALTTCAKCKSGVEHHYCLRNRSRPSKSVSSGVELAMKNLYAENAVHTVEGTFPTNCSTDASWMITFRLKDERTTSIYLGAHPASHAPAKLKQFSEEMPKVLEFECCSYEDFLRTVFKGCDPDEEDIGLYFFPDNVNRSDEYSFLLEQLSGQFFLRSCIDEVDLLLFSSKVLQKDNSEWYKHDFLWGMFRHCHGKLRSAMEGTVVEDMEIDMRATATRSPMALLYIVLLIAEIVHIHILVKHPIKDEINKLKKDLKKERRERNEQFDEVMKTLRELKKKMGGDEEDSEEEAGEDTGEDS
ncbi:hypothetical protein POM88_030445 [Heracleum sosnowskyi]|uniref:AIPP2-like SPOC-like domain-containing protein n=1 Tax=Heracleum sosnowskyi TaxID=360622 RepID=A0AAD8MIM1_9APIA|nr:hypothetical protein POM88_030445 [Heracleum sosnowskyi]